MIVTKRNAHEVDEMRAIAERLELSFAEYVNMVPTIYGGAESLPSQSVEHLRKRKIFTGCNAGHTFFHVDPRGNASICKVGRDPRISLMDDGVEGLRRLGGVADGPLLRQGGCTGCTLSGTCGACMTLVQLYRKAKAPLATYCQHRERKEDDLGSRRVRASGPDAYALLVTLLGMRFRWDWLSPVVPIPYVPTLGPVQPRALSAQLFNSVADIANTGRFLSYDKDRRWSGEKDEQVIVDGIVLEPGLTMIPTFTRRCGLVKIYHYGDSSPQLSELAQWARTRWATFGLATGRVIWFQRAPEGARTRLLLKKFGDQDKRNHGDVIQLTDCAVADTFPAFAEELRADGFAFLYQRMKVGLPDGPILVRVEDRRIVGAVGPLGTLLDSTGTRMQQPQYFAVHPHCRRRGHGRALWRAANGAKFKVLQAAAGSASEVLYLSEGLATLGFVCSRDVL